MRIDMSRASKSMFAFSAYSTVAGALLIVAPNTLIGIAGIHPTHEVWIRVVGMLALILGYYYFCAARADLVPFFRASVCGRIAVFVFLGVFVLLGWSEPGLFLFGLIDLSFAIWTALALRADRCV
jgi:hypothetical protein